MPAIFKTCVAAYCSRPDGASAQRQPQPTGRSGGPGTGLRDPRRLHPLDDMWCIPLSLAEASMRRSHITGLVHFGLALAIVGAAHPLAQAGKVWTPQELFRRNVGSREQQDRQFPPHKIIGNVYYVGTETLASFLITTPQGHILVNSMYERNVPTIRKSVEDLGFKFTDIKIVLGSHAHADHMEGDALVKELSGAQVMAMAEDVPALQAMKPGGKAHPIDKVLHDGDLVSLGGLSLVPRLTPGHTKGCTTWTMKVRDGEMTYDVVIVSSVGVNPGMKLVGNTDNPAIAEDFMRAFKVLRSLHADVPLGSHPGMFNMVDKHAKLGGGAANPYIDPAGYIAELDLAEEVFSSALAQQRAAAK
jgi:metallo-beta-lactamase class B